MKEDNMKKIYTAIGIFLGVCSIIGIAYGGFKFYSCKADKVDVNKSMVTLTQTKADRTELEIVASDLYIYKLEQHRRYIQQRIWDIQRQYPNSYQSNSEYRRLVEELRQIDIKISAYYQRKGK